MRDEPFVVVELADRHIAGETMTHYARPGHADTLCGEARAIGGDVVESHPVPDCQTCRLLSGGYQHPL